MIQLIFTTSDTDVAAGRQKVFTDITAAVAARPKMSALIGQILPQISVPGGSVIHMADILSDFANPALDLLRDDLLVIDIAETLLITSGATPVVRGYAQHWWIRLRSNDGQTPALDTVFTNRWRVRPRITAAASQTAEMAVMDPGKTAVDFHETTTGVRWLRKLPPQPHIQIL